MLDQGLDRSAIPASGVMPHTFQDMIPAPQPCVRCGWRPCSDGICQSCLEWREIWDRDTATCASSLMADQLAQGYFSQWLNWNGAGRDSFERELHRGLFFSDSLSRSACFIALCLIATKSVDPAVKIGG